jgi:hypothetical protein
MGVFVGMPFAAVFMSVLMFMFMYAVKSFMFMLKAIWKLYLIIFSFEHPVVQFPLPSLVLYQIVPGGPDVNMPHKSLDLDYVAIVVV